ncbi:MAG: DUF2312 domain-containing protein [Holosporales bacterium]|jgi:uncharacterized protein (UPF0335 family)|nr:DUF2312 domain-containing protein [Holosporales bacterium]
MSNFDRFNVSASLIKQAVARLENLEEKKAEVLTDIKDTFAEAKAQGLDTAILRKLVKMRKMKKEDVEVEEELLEIYKRALES